MMTLGQADLGRIQGCHIDVELAFDLIHIQFVIGMSMGGGGGPTTLPQQQKTAYPQAANHLILQKALKLVLKSYPSQGLPNIHLE